jgi:hypothetical protein
LFFALAQIAPVQEISLSTSKMACARQADPPEITGSGTGRVSGKTLPITGERTGKRTHGTGKAAAARQSVAMVRDAGIRRSIAAASDDLNQAEC